MNYFNKFVELIPKKVIKQIEGKKALIVGWVTEKDPLEPVNKSYEIPVSIEIAIDELERNRDKFEGGHILLDDHSVLWVGSDSFIGYDTHESLERKLSNGPQKQNINLNIQNEKLECDDEYSKIENLRVKQFNKNDLQELLSGRYQAIRDIPILGNQLPAGWARFSLLKEFKENDRGISMGEHNGYGIYFVDKSGYGNETEPALTIPEFISKLKTGIGYAIIEEGQYQSKVGLFTKVKRMVNHD